MLEDVIVDIGGTIPKVKVKLIYNESGDEVGRKMIAQLQHQHHWRNIEYEAIQELRL